MEETERARSGDWPQRRGNGHPLPLACLDRRLPVVCAAMKSVFHDDEAPVWRSFGGLEPLLGRRRDFWPYILKTWHELGAV